MIRFWLNEVSFLDAQRAGSSDINQQRGMIGLTLNDQFFAILFFFFFKFKEDKLSYLVTRSNYKSQMCSEQNLFGKLFSSKTNLCSSDSSPGNLQLEFPILSYCLFHLWAICHDFIVRIIFTSYPHCFYRFVPLLMCLCYDSPTLSIWGI